MTEPEIDRFACLGPDGFHALSIAVWPGPAGGPVTICVHGLTRNARDFDALAHVLARRGSVWAPDMPGRGLSPWLGAAAGYSYPVYLADVAALIARTRATSVDFVGTSMGGLIGMLLAASVGAPIRRLVLNDVGPFIPKASLERIGQYVGRTVSFTNVAEAETYLRRLHAPFGGMTDADWQHMARHSIRTLGDGKLALAYDPAIAAAFQGTLVDVDLWAFYDRVTCPTLVLRGAQSDVLPAETAAEMTRRGPRAKLATIDGSGHAPGLTDPDQIALIEQFLDTA